MPKVSIIVLAYNHERFIGQALDGILNQQVDFDYEILIGEDCSTDRTRALVQEYEHRYPGRLRPFYRSHNVGPGANFKACWAECTGQYIAVLDGDDYWTSPDKLAQQVACLDAEPEISFCFHYVEKIREQQPEAILFPPRTTQTHYFFSDFLVCCHAQTGSLLLRNGCRTLPDWLFTTYPIDFPLMVLYAEVGPARLLPTVMSRYRLHMASTWSSTPYQQNEERFRAMYSQLATHYASTQHANLLKRTLCGVYLAAADNYLLRYGMPRKAAQLLRKAALLPQAYTMPRARILASLTLRWLWQWCRPSRLVTPTT
ncbi:MAG: glycosyltransferase family 2 protein [Janthinobacterium lividum]